MKPQIASQCTAARMRCPLLLLVLVPLLRAQDAPSVCLEGGACYTGNYTS